MSVQLLRNLKGLRIQVFHAPDSDGKALVDHLHRIGCNCETTWPLPDAISPNADVVLISIEPEHRQKILKLFNEAQQISSTLIAVASYEDPGTLQIILECGALAIIERPIRPFGLLTNLTIARSLWMERQDFRKRIRKLERKLAGNNRIIKAKNILMETQKLDEQEAYENIRRQAMAKRISMDDLAVSIINAYELLTSR
ncbi:Two-component response regulator, AmiR/NasT family, consists of REC and RNA-binding antiterminator (ANTAR) domains [Mesorhizobium sp. YR577]|nr:ANTAR domain-containing protein [Mesorhizobium sp. YR577]SFU19057.1 Two-component response regulator, AmiR/NasT family, consists of REC and RNA-binding antiterminator (ANTAR) domains [Mesorhizobium sp. YR577]